MNFRAKIKKAFFDQVKVTKAMDRKTARAMIRTGGTMRKHAQYSMRSRQKPAPAGQPPHARKRKLLKRELYFSYSDQTKSVVVGPIITPNSKQPSLPKLMEQGGHITYVTKKLKLKVKKYAPRPYMNPALEANRGKIAGYYAEGGLT